MLVIKRDGTEVVFDSEKIRAAVAKANAASTNKLSAEQVVSVTERVTAGALKSSHAVGVEDIQDLVEQELMREGGYEVAQRYIRYRYTRILARQANSTDQAILSLIDCDNEVAKQENANKNPTVAAVQRDYMAGEVSRDLTKRVLLPPDIWKAHEEGIIHFHDSDYFAQHMHNCCLINLEDMLENGTVISETFIDPPKSFATACNIATQIVAQVASNQYGGQTITLAHLAPFVEVSRKKHRNNVRRELETLGGAFSEGDVNRLAEIRVRNEVKAGIQTIQYQVITLMTTNGQAPFITVCLYLNEARNEQEKADLALCIEEILNQRILGVKNKVGVYITPAFPKLIYVLQEDNIDEGQPYWYLTELAAKCTAKRMVPDYVSEKIMKEVKGDCYPPMGCRSFLTPYKDADGKPKYYGRFNQGVVTINLVDVALSSRKDEEAFWNILDERLELCHRALRIRHERLKGTLSDTSPIHWQYGALARLKPGEVIDPLLYNGYSTLSLGYAGLYECVRYMTGVSHTAEGGHAFALSVMQHLNDACARWKSEEHIDYSVYGTPLESTTYKFAKCLQKRFGVIPGVTEYNFITNSYHVHVAEEIDAFTKLKFESDFQKLSPGGAISYVEVPDLQNNIPAVLSLIRYIYDHIMYAELNTKSDYCQKCGFDGEIVIVKNEQGKQIWRCPNCGNTDQSSMNIARRVCGYIGTQGYNAGKVQELSVRKLHL